MVPVAGQFNNSTGGFSECVFHLKNCLCVFLPVRLGGYEYEQNRRFCANKHSCTHTHTHTLELEKWPHMSARGSVDPGLQRHFE